MHRTEPSRLQSLALQLSEKVGTLVENNERILEIKQGNYGGKLSKYMNVGRGERVGKIFVTLTLFEGHTSTS